MDASPTDDAALAAGVGVPPDKDLVSAPAKERQDARAPICTCTEDESSDGSASCEDDPHCPIHGWCSWQAECGRLREELRIREESQIPVVPEAAQKRLEAAEAECVRLREQLDAATEARKFFEVDAGDWRKVVARLEEAEARVGALTGALEQVRHALYDTTATVDDRVKRADDVARAALGDVAAGEQTTDLGANSAKNAEVREVDTT